MDRRLDEFAARQYGVFTRAQAVSVRMTRRMIERRIESGRWIKLATGVYAYASAPPKWERQLSAAVLSRSEAVVDGRSAAYLHGFDGFGLGRPEIVVPTNANARSPLARVRRDSHYADIATDRRSGFLTASAEETIWSLATRLSPQHMDRLMDNGLAAKKVTIDRFEPILNRIEGERRAGGPLLKALLDERRLDGYQPPTTELEAHLYPLLDHPEIPSYQRQCPFTFDEGVNAVLDAFIDLWGMIVEADGRRWHTRKSDFERDRRRDNAAAAAGLIVLRFTYRLLLDDPDYCLRVILETGKSRSESTTTVQESTV